MGVFAVGQPVSRTEDPRLLTGRGLYINDRTLPREAQLYILRSPHAHAKINGIDTAAAASARGVLAVLTGAVIVGQILSAGGMALRLGLRPVEALTVGVGMCARAELAFILASLALAQLAGPWAQVALNATVVQTMPVIRRHGVGRDVRRLIHGSGPGG